MTAPPGLERGLMDGAFWGSNPHDTFTWLRANAPVWRDPVTDFVAVTRYDDLKAVSKQPTLFSNAGGIRPDNDPLPMMIDMDDPAHLRRRQLVNKGFTPRRVRETESAIRRACHEILDAVCARGSCDFVMDIAAWLPMIMIGDALGVAPSDRKALLTWSDDMLKGLVGGEVSQLEAAGVAYMAWRDYAVSVIADRRVRSGDDLMSILVHAEVDGHRLDDEELIAESLLILIGGDETTRHVISGGLYQLLTDRSQWDELRADRSLLDGAVEEMLRWVSPIKNMARTVTAATELGGLALVPGDKLVLIYPSANRDDAHFDDPFRFDIHRHPNEHVAFGFGNHFCLGNSLARLELKVMFDTLLDRLPDLALADPDEPAHRPANFISGYEHLPVRYTASAPV